MIPEEFVFFVIEAVIALTIAIDLEIVQNFGTLFIKKDFVKTVSGLFTFHINVMTIAFVSSVRVGYVINTLLFYVSIKII